MGKFPLGFFWQKLKDIIDRMEVTTSGDDEGIIITKQLSVGTATDGRELVVGEGDSIPFTRVFHIDYSNLSGTTVTGATDITEEAASDEGSTFPLFNGTTVDSAILVCGATTYGGAKVKIDTLATVEPENVIAEYLEDNAPTWQTASFMVKDADFPRDSKANILASCSSCSEQWRFGFNPDAIPTAWDEVELSVNGELISGYWAIFRVIAPITGDPIIQQLKRHTNRWEGNDDGQTEYFGRSRYPRALDIQWTNTLQMQGFSPANENIDFGVGLSLVYTDNKFNTNANDGRGGLFFIQEGQDTSVPVKLMVEYQPMSADSGDVKWELITTASKVGEVMDSSSPSVSVISIESLNNELNVVKSKSFFVDVSRLLPGDFVAFGVKRLGADVDDDFPAPIKLVNIRSVGYFCNP